MILGQAVYISYTQTAYLATDGYTMGIGGGDLQAFWELNAANSTLIVGLWRFAGIIVVAWGMVFSMLWYLERLHWSKRKADVPLGRYWGRGKRGLYVLRKGLAAFGKAVRGLWV